MIRINLIIKPKRAYWITRNRQKIRVDKMSTDHIMNCMKLWNRGKIPKGYLGGKDKWIKIFNQELLNRIGG